MKIDLIKETENFKLVSHETTILFSGIESTTYTIYKKYENTEERICSICGFSENQTTLIARGTNIQDCITSWDLYKEFIMLVDDAYERVSLKQNSNVVLD